MLNIGTARYETYYKVRLFEILLVILQSKMGIAQGLNRIITNRYNNLIKTKCLLFNS